MTPTPWNSALIGQVIAGYRIDAFLGGGAFGLVFEATDLATGSRFAIKILIPAGNAESVSEFDREGLLLQKLIKCSGVINWVDSGVADIEFNLNGMPVPIGFKYHVMALASGVLEELVVDPAKRRDLPWGERISHWRGAVKGVHQMHLNKIAHRDLKSSNCLLVVQKGESEVRLADLGRSKDFALGPSLPFHQYLLGRGDMRHAPPEFLWFQGGSTEADFRNADLYGLGSLLAELASGHPITALAIGSWQDAKLQGRQDFINGRQRNLGILRPQFRRAIEDLSNEFPRAIRHEMVELLGQVCDPVPAMRQPKQKPGNQFKPDNGLAWLLRRADILSRRLSVSSRHTNRKSESRSAS